MTEEAHDQIRSKVRTGYGQIAGSGSALPLVEATGGCCGGSSMCVDELAEKIGYSADELSLLPEGANMGLSCGNPAAIAELQPGQVVLDLGAGGGFDIFLAGPKVGAAGRAIGVDMTSDMLTKARHNVAAYRQRTGLDNVEFRLGEIEHLPVADASVDVVISNCVINLSPDKPQVWREIARVLRPGGQVAVSDMALLKPLPAEVVNMVEALIGCISGAVLVDETERMAREAGLVEIRLTPHPQYMAALSDSGDPLHAKIAAQLPADFSPADYVTSLSLQARKPG